MDEETQTESIIPRTKWTQCPLSFTLSTTGTLEKLKTECSGVGTAEEEDQTSGGVYSRFAENHASLYQFVEKFGQVGDRVGWGFGMDEFSSQKYILLVLETQSLYE